MLILLIINNGQQTTDAAYEISQKKSENLLMFSWINNETGYHIQLLPKVRQNF